MQDGVFSAKVKRFKHSNKGFCTIICGRKQHALALFDYHSACLLLHPLESLAVRKIVFLALRKSLQTLLGIFDGYGGDFLFVAGDNRLFESRKRVTSHAVRNRFRQKHAVRVHDYVKDFKSAVRYL